MREVDGNSKRKKSKCCSTGLHFTKNEVCIQSLKPFCIKTNGPIDKPETQSLFCKSILEHREEPQVVEFPEIEKQDVLEILNDFAQTFNIRKR